MDSGDEKARGTEKTKGGEKPTRIASSAHTIKFHDPTKHYSSYDERESDAYRTCGPNRRPGLVSNHDEAPSFETLL